MVVSRGIAGFSRGREHLAVVSRAVVAVVSRESWPCPVVSRGFLFAVVALYYSYLLVDILAKVL